MNSLVQSLLLRTYRARPVQRALATSMGRRIFEAAYFQYKERIEVVGTGALKPFIASGDWAVDVGANIGFFTEKFARWVGQGGRVLAVEPDAVNFRRLEQRLRERGLADYVIAKLGAAADRDGELYLAVNPDHPGDHALSDIGGTPVGVWRIDSLVAAAGCPRVGLIKIDVQGAEMKVLQGCAATLARCRPAIFIEICDDGLRSFGSSADEVLRWLEANGYGFSMLDRSRARPVTRQQVVDIVARRSSAYCDVLARRTRADAA